MKWNRPTGRGVYTLSPASLVLECRWGRTSIQCACKKVFTPKRSSVGARAITILHVSGSFMCLSVHGRQYRSQMGTINFFFDFFFWKGHRIWRLNILLLLLYPRTRNIVIYMILYMRVRYERVPGADAFV